MNIDSITIFRIVLTHYVHAAQRLSQLLIFFLHCLHYNDICETLLNELKSVDENILKLSVNNLINLLLYGDSKFDSNQNTRLLNAKIKYVIDSGRFTVLLVYYRNECILLSYFVLFLLLFLFLQNMTELFTTLFSPVFIYLYLTQIQCNLCLIERAVQINDFSFKSLFFCLFIVIALAFLWLQVRVLVFCFVLY